MTIIQNLALFNLLHLLHIQPVHSSPPSSPMSPETTVVKTIQFTSPKTVDVIETPLPPLSSAPLFRTICSAMSPGTEMLVYNGEMPQHIPLDATLEAYSKPFSYPACYGYAAVGELVHAYDSRPAGSRAFAFREHTSHFTQPPDQVLWVPDDVTSQDACFLPHVETALCLAMDAAPLPGESIFIVGQGIIGLLLTAVFRHLHPYNKVTTADLDPVRRQTSTQVADAHASHNPLDPTFKSRLSASLNRSGADVSVDVSGSSNGLQTAIDGTRDHGRVIIGSWYGAKSVTLPHLGARFHRSHIHLVSSQVSEIPPHLSGRWSKQRRFQLAWHLLRDISPASRFAIPTIDVCDAAQAYARVAEGSDMQVIFKYQHSMNAH